MDYSVWFSYGYPHEENISSHLLLPLPLSVLTNMTDSFISMATKALQTEMKTQGGAGKPLEDPIENKKYIGWTNPLITSEEKEEHWIYTVKIHRRDELLASNKLYKCSPQMVKVMQSCRLTYLMMMAAWSATQWHTHYEAKISYSNAWKAALNWIRPLVHVGQHWAFPHCTISQGRVIHCYR